MVKILRRTLSFPDACREEAFVKLRHQKLKSRALLGLWLLLLYVVTSTVCRYLFRGPYVDTPDGRWVQDIQALLWAIIALTCLAWIVFSTSRLSSRVGSGRYEVGTGVVACMVAIFIPLQDPWYLAKLCGLQPQPVIREGVVTSDHAVLLGLDVWLTACHFMLAIRWRTLLPFEIICVLSYFIPATCLGSQHEAMDVCLNGVTFAILTFAAAVGKRDLEAYERTAFVQVAEERTLRAQAENRLHFAEKDEQDVRGGQAVHERAQAALSDTTSMPETTATGMIFDVAEGGRRGTGNVQEHLEQMVDIGYKEHWLVHASDLQILPDRVLGCGGFGLVVVALYHCAQVVVKMPRGRGDQHAGHSKLLATAQELRIFRRLRHPNIVSYYGACINTESPDICLVLEYVRGSQLRDVVCGPCLGVSTCAFRCRLLNDVCSALSYLHSQQPAVIHGDIKDSNLLVERQGSSFRAKLLDFGLSRLLTRSAQQLGGTARWMAPEVITRREDLPALSADIFSLGRLIYFIIIGQQPLRNLSSDEVLAQVRAGSSLELSYPQNAMLREQTQCLVALCTAHEPHCRPSITDVQAQLRTWSESAQPHALSSVIAKAFPVLRPSSDINAELQGIRIIREQQQLGGDQSDSPDDESAGSHMRQMLHRDFAETPLETKLMSVFALLAGWNVKNDVPSCCALHTLSSDLQQVLNTVNCKPCSDMPTGLTRQCPQCKVLDHGTATGVRECFVCGYVMSERGAMRGERSATSPLQSIPEHGSATSSLQSIPEHGVHVAAECGAVRGDAGPPRSTPAHANKAERLKSLLAAAPRSGLPTSL